VKVSVYKVNFTSELVTDECSHRSRYRLLNGSKLPLPSNKIDHIFSNLLMIVAAVFSMLSGEPESFCSCSSENIGGGLSTFTPHPGSKVKKERTLKALPVPYL
jgi:hypothetical protein